MSTEATEVQHPAEMPTEFTESSAAAAIEGLLSDEEDGQPEESHRKTPKKPAREEEGDEPNDALDEDEGQDETESDEEDRTDDEESESEDEGESDDDANDANLLTQRVRTTDGEEVTVEEAVKGYQRNKDYTQKTQALAQEKKQTLAERQSLVETRGLHTQRLAELDQIVNAFAPEPDWAALREAGDDGALARAYVEHQMRQQKLAELRQEMAAVQEAMQEDQQAILDERLREERTALLDAIPEWKDEKVRKAEKAKILAFAESLGLADDLKQVIDHRVMVLVRDAMRYRELQAKKPDVKAKIDKVTVVKPGPKRSTEGRARETTQITRQKQRFAKTHHVGDAARLIEMIEFDD